ncbi:MAG: DUF4271 domain-containing protein [Chitinophagia bacterium]|nr:DUF4271 domain-containing protein [Chitinophagia bacterium]
MRIFLFLIVWMISSGLALGQDGSDFYQTRFVRDALRSHPYFNIAGPIALQKEITTHQPINKDLVFYAIVALVLFFAIIRRAFPKYMQDLFRLFFRTTLKQRHLSEQLSQTPLPSLLLNLYFFLLAGFYLSFWIEYAAYNPFDSFWVLFFYLLLAVTVAYLVKYTTLRLTGWLFKAHDAAQSYLFTVFTINKMTAIFLLPLVVVMAFSAAPVFTVALTLSWVVLIALLLYRLLLSFRVVRKQVQLSGFHFLLYVAGFEIAPLLVIYKLIMINFA